MWEIMPSITSYSMPRPDEVASFEEPTSDHRTDAPSSVYPEELDQSVLRSSLATNIDRGYSGFPHSYSEMPTGYSVKIEKGRQIMIG
jgi:hypothetical protein